MKGKWFFLLLVIMGGALVYALAQKREALRPPQQPLGETSTTLSVSPTPTGSGAASFKEISLTITAPANGATVRSPKVVVRGKTVARAEIFVNEVETVADERGNFSATITLEEGENYILVVATDEQGQVAEKELVVTYDSGQ
ncbi:MAG: hypothetical protein ACOY0S_04035 [Patescibacteria group bacterium]